VGLGLPGTGTAAGASQIAPAPTADTSSAANALGGALSAAVLRSVLSGPTAAPGTGTPAVTGNGNSTGGGNAVTTGTATTTTTAVDHSLVNVAVGAGPSSPVAVSANPLGPLTVSASSPSTAAADHVAAAALPATLPSSPDLPTPAAGTDLVMPPLPLPAAAAAAAPSPAPVPEPGPLALPALLAAAYAVRRGLGRKDA
jgi:hypothetical protein